MRDVIYHDRPRKSRGRIAKGWVVFIIIIVLVVMISAAMIARMKRDVSMQSIEALRQTVSDACVQCYAIEGKYPVNISYLEQNYGVRYNGSRYVVSLKDRGTNELPEVVVSLKQEAGA